MRRDPDDRPVPAIEATIRDYIEGWYEGDVTRMERALHPDLVKRAPLGRDGRGAELRAVTRERMVALTREGGGRSPGAPYEIDVHDIYGPIASALVRSVEYLDYLQLVETTDGWKIVHILFRPRD